MPRRDFLALGGTGLAAFLLPKEAVAGPFVDEEFSRLVPADKKFRPEWIASLTDRGEPERYRGADLRFIGMPVGGIGCGTLYLGGDGKLWLWDIFNDNQNGIVPKTITVAGRPIKSQDGSAYVQPPTQQGPVDQGFALRYRLGQESRTVMLDHAGFRDVLFTGQYPIGTIDYEDPGIPIAVRLEAFSPFIPLNASESGLPATIMSLTLTNRGSRPIESSVIGWLENAIAVRHRQRSGLRRNTIHDVPGATILSCSASSRAEPQPEPRPDILIEDWSKPGYAGWTVEGKAFGTGPVEKAKIPAYQGDVGGPGQHVVNSHATAPGRNVGEKDAQVGKLVSKPFTIDRRYLGLWIGGGSHAGKTCVNLRVDGRQVASVTGKDQNRMRLEVIDLSPFAGQNAVLEIIDDSTGSWGNIGVGRIVQTDRKGEEIPFDQLPDFGTMALGLLGASAAVKHAQGGWDGESVGRAETQLAEKLVGAVGRSVTLAAGQSTTVSFVIAWHFPNLSLGKQLRGRFYASRFADADAVVRHVVEQFESLTRLTRLWRDTWYDSTLPYWFLNRAFANTSTLATTTCHRLHDGRFWAWEGIGCCPGTCTHVWHYVQAMGRLFPELERDLRERVDFGLAFDARRGVIRFRGEFGDTFAVDGQCGTILRAYREHQMSANDAFLRRIWPRVKQAMTSMMERDKTGTGILYGPMHNTLDADWFGVVPWIVGLYHAALRAAEEMAKRMGDDAFAKRCRQDFEAGRVRLEQLTWKEEYGYYIHLGDPAHAREVGSYEGCHIDQVLGQSWAWQVGLGRVMTEEKVRGALRSLWKYSVTPDVGPFRAVQRAGRWYAMPGDGGLLMVTFPFGRPPAVSGPGAWSAMYFNECMTGFEWQVAGHMLWEGLVTEGLAIARLIHDRYHGRLRNPYNEIECSDHYARAMASYGAFLAACGFEYDGPAQHIGFAPRVRPEQFRAAFTAAEAWGTLAQTISERELKASIRPVHGRLSLKSLALELPAKRSAREIRVHAVGELIPIQFEQKQQRLVVRLDRSRVILADQTLDISVSLDS